MTAVFRKTERVVIDNATDRAVVSVIAVKISCPQMCQIKSD